MLDRFYQNGRPFSSSSVTIHSETNTQAHRAPTGVPALFFAQFAPIRRGYVLQFKNKFFLNRYRHDGVWATADLQKAKVFANAPISAADFFCGKVLAVITDMDGRNVRTAVPPREGSVNGTARIQIANSGAEPTLLLEGKDNNVGSIFTKPLILLLAFLTSFILLCFAIPSFGQQERRDRETREIRNHEIEIQEWESGALQAAEDLGCKRPMWQLQSETFEQAISVYADDYMPGDCLILSPHRGGSEFFLGYAGQFDGSADFPSVKEWTGTPVYYLRDTPVPIFTTVPR